MQVLFFVCLCAAWTFSIWVFFSNSWVIFEDDSLKLRHGLFETCFYQKIKSGMDQYTDDFCRSFGIEPKYYVFIPGVMLIGGWVIVIFFMLSAIFLRLIGYRKLGLSSMGIMFMISGVITMTASGLMITSPLLKDDEKVFRRELSILITPKKTVGSAFYGGWISGLLFFCSGLVGIALINRKLPTRKKKMLPPKTSLSHLSSKSS